MPAMPRLPIRHLVATVALSVAWLAPDTVLAQEPAGAQAAPASSSASFHYGGDAMMVSSYVWRGGVESDKPCLQPGGWIGFGPVSFEGWMNLEMADGRLRNAEYDLSLYYTREGERATVAGGLTNYFFATPEGGRERHSELAVLLTGTGLLNPSVEAYYSVSAEKGAHVTTAVSHPFRFAPRAAVTAEVALGYNHRMWIEKSGFSDVRGTLKLTLDHRSDRIRIEAGVDYTHALMRDQFSNQFVAFVSIHGE